MTQVGRPISPRRTLQRAFSLVDTETIKALVTEQQVDVDERDAGHGLQTCLMRLCHVHMDRLERAAILSLILAQYPDLNIQDSTGRTALAHACIAEKTDIIEMLSRLDGCDPNIADNDGNTALIYAVKSRKPEVVKLMIDCFTDKGLDVDHRNKKGVCALTEAESRYDSDICRILIKDGGADPSQLDTVQYHRGQRTPRSISPEILPTSPRLQRTKLRNQFRQQRSEDLSPMILSHRLAGAEQGAVSKTEVMALRKAYSLDSASMMTFNNSSPTDCGSESSSLPDLQEEEEEEDGIEGDPPQYTRYHRKRRNSKSLPDLRDFLNSGMVVSPVSSPRVGADEPHPRLVRIYQRSQTLEERSLPQLSEEEEESASLGANGATPSSSTHTRRGSVSLPDLRDCKKYLVSNKSSQQDISDRQKPCDVLLSDRVQKLKVEEDFSLPPITPRNAGNPKSLKPRAVRNEAIQRLQLFENHSSISSQGNNANNHNNMNSQ